MWCETKEKPGGKVIVNIQKADGNTHTYTFSLYINVTLSSYTLLTSTHIFSYLCHAVIFLHTYGSFKYMSMLYNVVDA